MFVRYGMEVSSLYFLKSLVPSPYPIVFFSPRVNLFHHRVRKDPLALIGDLVGAYLIRIQVGDIDVEKGIRGKSHAHDMCRHLEGKVGRTLIPEFLPGGQ